eukprot:CAMPEP_0196591562 /NCGR_PEP_ID=MMETSP1081-20130531/70053_1 /TAXON_ID=36882 /ORGANISM="Pyramimonas amylifera, Strain CCMP720" /LENGTH=171 /DNA_ID=CAMNT_0041914957 /DNA_START=554 /DNA_END=1069 /DNA_ORIENTATION=+
MSSKFKCPATEPNPVNNCKQTCSSPCPLSPNKSINKIAHLQAGENDLDPITPEKCAELKGLPDVPVEPIVFQPFACEVNDEEEEDGRQLVSGREWLQLHCGTPEIIEALTKACFGNDLLKIASLNSQVFDQVMCEFNVKVTFGRRKRILKAAAYLARYLDETVTQTCCKTY